MSKELLNFLSPIGVSLVGLLGIWVSNKYAFRAAQQKALEEGASKAKQLAQTTEDKVSDLLASKEVTDNALAQSLRDELRAEMARRDAVYRVALAENETRHRDELQSAEGRYVQRLAAMEMRHQQEMQGWETRYVTVIAERDEFKGLLSQQFEQFGNLKIEFEKGEAERAELRDKLNAFIAVTENGKEN